ncbi:MAG: hypothetical protein IPK13_10610 [Deltaproteobacteria bacterium]|nr:hypothetical protein [Deltaproteobacteria bacterium]
MYFEAPFAVGFFCAFTLAFVSISPSASASASASASEPEPESALIATSPVAVGDARVDSAPKARSAPTLDLAPEDLSPEDRASEDRVPAEELGASGMTSTASVSSISSTASTSRARAIGTHADDGECVDRNRGDACDRRDARDGRERSGEDDDVLLKGLEPMRRAQESTVIGGYGQLDLTSRRVGPRAERFDVRGTVRRLVLFVSHHLTEDVSIYTEFEWENAIACSSCRGSVEVEQVAVDWKLIDSLLTLRGGLVLVPMGIINQWHEPPIFNGVERPSFDEIVIPSTWRELAIGATGRFAEFLSYELYLMTPLDPTGLGPAGLAGARGQGSFASSRTPALSGRIEVEPWLGTIAGASFYASDIGTNGDFFDASGSRSRLRFPIFGYAVDGRYKRRGLEARFVWSQWFMPKAEDLLRARRADGSLWFPNATQTGPVPIRAEGGYVELGYDVLRLFMKSHHVLVVFGRVERYSTQAKVPSAFVRNPSLVVMEYTYGLSYRPIPQLVLKLDTQLRDREKGLDELAVNAGLGFMF